MSTEYVILKRRTATDKDTSPTWTVLTDVEAASATAAVRAYLNGADEGGEFVAVPARSWQPVKVSIEKAIRLG